MGLAGGRARSGGRAPADRNIFRGLVHLGRVSTRVTRGTRVGLAGGHTRCVN